MELFRSIESAPDLLPLSRKSVLSYGTLETPIEWRRGQRLEHLFEERCQALAEAGEAEHPALLFEGFSISYQELDERSNQFARYLRQQGIRPGDRVGHLFDKTPETYVALFGILKAGAAFLPFDASTPEERLRFIARDAELKAIVASSLHRELASSAEVAVVVLEQLGEELEALDVSSMGEELELPEDDIAYIIYTSGTTGHPKGVAIEHSSICNFVQVAARVYGYRPEDRVYQGMTLAFDFSFEEVFVPLWAGSTLVPSPGGLMLGCELWEFLQEKEVTAMCCVPTLLASINDELPALRLILLGGEATPQDLVGRWARPGRLILNTYGPTEATITATYGELRPDRPVTIGVPLPTYSIAIVEADKPKLVPFGESGEICIAGIGLAVGYLNLEQKTREKFIPDFLDLPNNPSGRLYRTGDLGRITAEGEVEFQGRIDTQVKLRGYRIELTEIESVLLEQASIAQVVVDAVEVEPGEKELVAYYTQKPETTELDRSALYTILSKRLPRYMVPVYLEKLEELPMLPSNKVNRKVLPLPEGERLMALAGEVRPPDNALEAQMVEAMQEVLQIPALSTDAHFFEELGANSLVLARFCAQVRERLPDYRLSIRDGYQHPTIQRLAAHLASQSSPSAARETEAMYTPSRLSYYLTGVMQSAFLVASAFLAFAIFMEGAKWILAAYGSPALYWRAWLYSMGLLALSFTVSIGGKWLLIGRFKAESVPLWGPRYFRLWVARQLMSWNPVAAFSGTPLYNLYLRCLGADVSLSAVVETRSLPFCTDLLSIGPHTVIRKNALITGYKVENNRMRLGSIEIGKEVYIGVGCVVDIDSSIGDHAELGHASCVAEGQKLNAHGRYHGSPAEQTETRYAQLKTGPSVVWRGFLYSLFFFSPVFFALPLFLYLLLAAVEPGTVAALVAIIDGFALAPGRYLPALLKLTGALYIASLLGALLVVSIWPRIYNIFLKAGRSYRLYGIRYFLFRSVRAVSNSSFLNVLFGDSSSITTYLKAIGYNLNEVIQTGSNFGCLQSHDSPFLCDIGTGTMVSDGLTMINTNQSSTNFRLEPAALKEHCFLGNHVLVPPESRVGKNCLLATKVQIPIDGPLREDVGLLGSPSFEIPRIVERDASLLANISPDEKARCLRRKNISNLLTALLYLFKGWLFGTVMLAFFVYAIYAYLLGGFFAWFGVSAAALTYALLHYALWERISTAFRPLKPGIFSIYDPRFWRVERYWKLGGTPIIQLFRGTPMRGWVWRLFGVRVGKMLFDDGGMITERSLVSIGDHCNINPYAILQSHSLEDGAFKCKHIHIGHGCNFGPGAFVHYGVNVRDRVTLEADSLLMKGESPAPHTVWQGNPAQRV